MERERCDIAALPAELTLLSLRAKTCPGARFDRHILRWFGGKTDLKRLSWFFSLPLGKAIQEMSD